MHLFFFYENILTELMLLNRTTTLVLRKQNYVKVDGVGVWPTSTFWGVEWKAIKTYSVPCTSTHDWWWKTFQIISAIKTTSHYLTVGGSLAYECKGRSGGKVSKKRCKRLDSDTATLARSEFTRWLGSLPIDVFFLVFVYSCRLFPLLLCNHFIRTKNGKLFSACLKKK